MDEQSERSALLSAITTEHFVLQTANNSTYSEASARSTLYIMALSSSLVAMGFVASSTDLLVPFAAISLPAVFLLGIFTVVRLVERTLESQQCLTRIARPAVWCRPRIFRHNSKHDRGHQQCRGRRGPGASHPFSKPLRAFLGECCRGDCRCADTHVAVLRVPALAFRRL